MNKITELATQLASIDKEEAKLESLKEAASADLSLAAKPGISIKEARVKILDARLSFDLADGQLKKIEPLREKVEAELLTEIRESAARWNALVLQNQRTVEENLIRGTLPEFEHDERAARRWWGSEGRLGQMPIFAKFRDAHFDESSLRRSQRWGVSQMAKHFCSWIERHSGALGIKPTDIESL